jgi:hypothetical protein
MNVESLKESKCSWALTGLLALCVGCVTATEVLYSDPEFSRTLREFDRLHDAGEFPGLGSHEVPSLSAYNMSEPYMLQQSYYVLWREVSRGCGWLRGELKAPPALRKFGSGWISGAWGLMR